MSKFDYQCEWCEGTVKKNTVPREVFRHARGFVMLVDVEVGVCARCGRKYYDAKVLRRVEEIALHRDKAERTESIPVAHV